MRAARSEYDAPSVRAADASDIGPQHPARYGQNDREIAGHRMGGPVSLDKSLKVANEMLAAHGLATAIHLEEGSGISRDNRFTARGLAKVLELFAPYANLLHGHDGGMNKTGTMDGIRTLAGYADTPSHGRVRFVISLTSNDDEMRFRLLRAIDSGL
jgi:D-alanyl-D-alanine carboxypeptidase/D-alanyl-D-alanine-endopeptidase (penicillin-binding protein 4)